MTLFDPFVRFVRDKRERSILKQRFNGCCACCQRKLIGQWDVDHIKPWSQGGSSHIENLQPLCSQCHTYKTTLENLMATPITLKNWGTKETCTGPLRRGHRDGLMTAIQRFGQYNATGDKKFQYTSVVLPTRYGKSHLARFLTLCGVNGYVAPDGNEVPPTISSAVFLTHRTFLSNQILDQAKWGGFADMFGIKNFQGIRAAEVNTQRMNSWRDINPITNQRPTNQFLVSTIQGLSKNIHPWIDWVEGVKRMGMLPPLFIADEAQFFGEDEDKCWGPALTELSDAGGLILPMTATPIRADGDHIPGFLQGAMEVEESERSGLVDRDLAGTGGRFVTKGTDKFGKLAGYGAGRSRQKTSVRSRQELAAQLLAVRPWSCRQMTNSHDLLNKQKANLCNRHR